MKGHGEKGHLNLRTRDQDSVVTNYGKHHRVVVSLALDRRTLHARVDHVHGDREPTVDEILRVARLHQGVTGRWVLESMERVGYSPVTECESTHYLFSREPRPRKGGT